jgi:glycosyltransferase involved in cell wall biosynthesis
LSSSKGFNVVHLSTSHAGGAGIAARRLHRELISAGVDSRFVALTRSSYYLKANELHVKRSIFSKILGAINSKVNFSLTDKTYFTLWSVSAFQYKDLKQFGNTDRTIFHIHNWFNLLNLKDLESLLVAGYKIVFTLHDQRLFTGGCHYSLDCKKFTSGCKKCPILPASINYIPALNLRRIQKVFTKFANQITIIAPSHWIMKLALESDICGNLRVITIPNVHSNLRIEGYYRTSHRPIKNQGILVLGVASMDKNSSLKGREILQQLMKLIEKEAGIFKIIYLSDHKDNDGTKDSFWNSIDYLLVPSVLDNSPNVIHEAKRLGIPVIATNVGGIGELLNPLYDYVVDLNESTPYSIANLINQISKQTPKTERKQIIKDYEKYSSSSLENIIELYQDISQTSYL